jgi:16S rRNA (guanine966-N2)-methyltransferase
MEICGGIYGGRILKSPSGNVRPTSSLMRQAIFNMLNVKGKIFLDMFAGSGAVGIEALSRGANKVCFVDIDVRTLLFNLKVVENKESYVVKKMDFRRFIEKNDECYDFVFLDPPYNCGFVEALEDKILNINFDILILQKSKDDKMLMLKDCTVVNHKKYGNSELVIYKKRGEQSRGFDGNPEESPDSKGKGAG